MIGIYIPDKGYLALPESLVFSLTIPSPLWFGGDATVIPGSYSLPIRLAANEINRAALGFPEYLNRKDFARSIEGVKLYLNGNYYDTGTLWVKLANAGQYQVQLVFGAATLQGLKSKTLKDYAYNGGLDGSVPSTPAGWQAFIETFYNAGDWTFSPVAYEDTEEDNDYQYRYMGGILVKKLLQHIFEAEGYTLVNTAFNAIPLNRVALMGENLYDITILDNGDNTIIEYDYWVPRMETLPFLKDLAKNFGLAFVVDVARKKVEILHFKSILAASATDLTDRVRSEIDINYEDQRQVKRMASTELRPPWRTDDDQIKLDTDGEEITSGLHTLTEEHTWPLIANRKGPRITGTFNTVAPGGTTYNLDPLDTVRTGLLFYRNPTTDGDAKNYTSLGIAHPSGNLQWNDADEQGFYETHWKQWLDELKLDVTVEMLWRWEDVWNMKNLMLQRILIYDEVGGGYQRFIIKEATISIDNRTGLKKTKQVLAQIRNW